MIYSIRRWCISRLGWYISIHIVFRRLKVVWKNRYIDIYRAFRMNRMDSIWFV